MRFYKIISLIAKPEPVSTDFMSDIFDIVSVLKAKQSTGVLVKQATANKADVCFNIQK